MSSSTRFMAGDDDGLILNRIGTLLRMQGTLLI